MFDAVRGVTKALDTSDTTAESTLSEWLTAFGSDGFKHLKNAKYVNIKTKDDSVPEHIKSQENIPIVTDSDYQILPDISNRLIKKNAALKKIGRYKYLSSITKYLFKLQFNNCWGKTNRKV